MWNLTTGGAPWPPAMDPRSFSEHSITARFSQAAPAAAKDPLIVYPMTLSARAARLALAVVVIAACDATPTTVVVLTITPVTPEFAVAGESIQPVALQAVGGDGPATFVLASGSLPAGVTLSAAGVISGTPAAAGRFPVTIRATNGSAVAATILLELVVRERIAITTTALLDAVRGQAYSASLTATGADSVFTWFVDAGSLPSGLSLSVAGLISGLPSEEQTAQFAVRVRSGDGQTTAREFTITVMATSESPALSIDTDILPPGLSGSPYRPLLSVSGGNGSQITWSVVGGSLPPGVALSPLGVFTGTPTTTGSYSFTVRSANSSRSDQKSLSVQIVADDVDRFNITRVDVSPVPANIEQHVVAAIARWENAIRGDLVKKEIPSLFLSPVTCSGFGSIPNGTFIDDIIVMVNIESIDGPSKVLGQAAPCAIRDNVLPLVGTLTLDSDDLPALAGTQKLTDVLFHEIGHILGLGTLWEVEHFKLVTGSGSSDPRFTGSQAVAEWQALGGGGSVPLEDDSHWRESNFGTEIMTAFVSPVGTPNLLSRVTLASMADLGFSVDYSAADSYQLPRPSLIAATNREPDVWEKVVREPILMLLPDGSARTIRP